VKVLNVYSDLNKHQPKGGGISNAREKFATKFFF
jgi:hypothetical protein